LYVYKIPGDLIKDLLSKYYSSLSISQMFILSLLFSLFYFIILLSLHLTISLNPILTKPIPIVTANNLNGEKC